MTKPNTHNFEQLLEQLNSLIEKLEAGDTDLDSSLGLFEDGVKMAREAQIALRHAEQKVLLLTDKNGIPGTSDFQPENGD